MGRTGLVAVAVLAVFLSASGVAATGASDAVSVRSVEYVGPGVVNDSASPTLVWQSGRLALRVTVDANDSATYYDLCAAARAEEEAEIINCTVVRPTNRTFTRTVWLDGWPANATGVVNVTALVEKGPGDEVLARRVAPATVIRKRGDLDRDGLSNAAEVERGTALRRADTDADGLADGPEVHSYGTSPRSQDTDGDGLLDAAEVQRYDTSPTDPDTDGDGTPDRREVAGGETAATPTTDPGESDGYSPMFVLGVAGAVGAVGVVGLVGGTVLARRSDRRLSLARVQWLGREFAVPVLTEAAVDEGNAGGRRDVDGDAERSDSEPLLDSDRVLEILEEEGGTVRQTEIVEATDWSKAKVSRVLSDMAERGDVEKVRLGRENVVMLPGESDRLTGRREYVGDADGDN